MLRNICLTITSILVTLVAVELLLRCLGFQQFYPSAQPIDGIIYDSEVGYRLKPNSSHISVTGCQNSLSKSANTSSKYKVETNELGLRDLYSKDFDNPGIVAIGDSTTYGHGVESADTWVEILQEKLRANVINAGVWGYGVNQYLPTLKRLKKQGVPIKIVLYGMSWNDVNSGSVPADSSVFKDGGFINPYTTKEQSRLSELKITLSDSAQNLILFKEGKAAIRNLVAKLDIKVNSEEKKRFDLSAEETREALLNITTFLKTTGAVLVVVAIAEPNFTMDHLWKIYSKLHPFSRNYTAELFKSFAEQNGMRFADATDSLISEYRFGNSRFESIAIACDGHYNKNGNQVIADVFFDLIKKDQLLSQVTHSNKIKKRTR